MFSFTLVTHDESFVIAIAIVRQAKLDECPKHKKKTNRKRDLRIFK